MTGHVTGPLDVLFAQVRNLIERDGRFPPSPTVEWPSKDTALAALSSIERHVQEDVEEWEQIAAEKGLPFLLDHLGLDGLANEVVAQKRHVQDMEKALTGAQFCLHVEYGRYRDSAPTDPGEQIGREEGMEIVGETLNEISALIGPYYAGKVSALPAREKEEE